MADGSDLIPVYVKAVDENGTVVPDYDGQVHISVSGEGELVGKDIPRIKAEDQVLESGIGSVFVRTSENAGDITITASAEGMDNGTAKVTTDTYTGTFVPDGSHTPGKAASRSWRRNSWRTWQPESRYPSLHSREAMKA